MSNSFQNFQNNNILIDPTTVNPTDFINCQQKIASDNSLIMDGNDFPSCGSNCDYLYGYDNVLQYDMNSHHMGGCNFEFNVNVEFVDDFDSCIELNDLRENLNLIRLPLSDIDQPVVQADETHLKNFSNSLVIGNYDVATDHVAMIDHDFDGFDSYDDDINKVNQYFEPVSPSPSFSEPQIALSSQRISHPPVCLPTPPFTGPNEYEYEEEKENECEQEYTQEYGREYEEEDEEVEDEDEENYTHQTNRCRKPSVVLPSSPPEVREKFLLRLKINNNGNGSNNNNDSHHSKPSYQSSNHIYVPKKVNDIRKNKSKLIMNSTDKRYFSRLNIQQLSKILKIKDVKQTKVIEANILSIFKDKCNFNLGHRTWIRDTGREERRKLIDLLFSHTKHLYPKFNQEILEIIIRRGSYAVMQTRLRKERKKA